MKKTSALALDIAGTAGVVLVSIGAWMAWHPLGFIAPGVMLIAAALLIPRE